ncbi:O-antigen ligase family protein [Amylolactobacillus amylophilus]|uniref:O-antigen ligase family protein n=1 Tax=Amylolactobacillus amylophilus TaxID=1603 RepID=UPI002092A5B2|nr:O-antigen ligase family protein [Amylolactobacillus amylophilus]
MYPFSPSTGRVSANDQVNIATADRSKASSKQLLQLREEMQQQPKQAKRLAQNYLDTHFDVRGTYGNVVSATNPIDKYPELWIDVLTWNAPDQVNFRKIEKANVDLLKQQIVPPVRLLLGISFVRINFFIFNYERDFINQFYTLGLLGIVLFILPFVLLCLYLAGKFCFKKQNWTVENFAYFFSFALFFGAAYLTGNVLDSITAGSLVAFFMGQNYRNYRV